MIKHFGKDRPYKGSEDNFQISTNNILKAKYPELYQYAFHVPNGGKRPTKTTVKYGKVRTYSAIGKKLKQMGTKAGVSDWIILKPVNGWAGAIIELKTKGGSLQETQKTFLNLVDNTNHFTAVCWSIDGFDEAINEFLQTII